jgi:hypothetical protein
VDLCGGLADSNDLAEAEAAVPAQRPIVFVCADDKGVDAFVDKKPTRALQQGSPVTLAAVGRKDVDLLQSRRRTG